MDLFHSTVSANSMFPLPLGLSSASLDSSSPLLSTLLTLTRTQQPGFIPLQENIINKLQSPDDPTLTKKLKTPASSSVTLPTNNNPRDLSFHDLAKHQHIQQYVMNPSVTSGNDAFQNGTNPLLPHALPQTNLDLLSIAKLSLLSQQLQKQNALATLTALLSQQRDMPKQHDQLSLASNIASISLTKTLHNTTFQKNLGEAMCEEKLIPPLNNPQIIKPKPINKIVHSPDTTNIHRANEQIPNNLIKPLAQPLLLSNTNGAQSDQSTCEEEPATSTLPSSDEKPKPSMELKDKPKKAITRKGKILPDSKPPSRKPQRKFEEKQSLLYPDKVVKETTHKERGLNRLQELRRKEEQEMKKIQQKEQEESLKQYLHPEGRTETRVGDCYQAVIPALSQERPPRVTKALKWSPECDCDYEEYLTLLEKCVGPYINEQKALLLLKKKNMDIDKAIKTVKKKRSYFKDLFTVTIRDDSMLY